MATKGMKESTRMIFDFLKENHGAQLTNNDIAEALGLSGRSVVGSVNSFVKKGWAVRTEVKTEGADGKPVLVKYISLTDDGMAYDPDAVEDEDAE